MSRNTLLGPLAGNDGAVSIKDAALLNIFNYRYYYILIIPIITFSSLYISGADNPSYINGAVTSGILCIGILTLMYQVEENRLPSLNLHFSSIEREELCDGYSVFIVHCYIRNSSVGTAYILDIDTDYTIHERDLTRFRENLNDPGDCPHSPVFGYSRPEGRSRLRYDRKVKLRLVVSGAEFIHDMKILVTLRERDEPIELDVRASDLSFMLNSKNN